MRINNQSNRIENAGRVERYIRGRMGNAAMNERHDCAGPSKLHYSRYERKRQSGRPVSNTRQ